MFTVLAALAVALLLFTFMNKTNLIVIILSTLSLASLLLSPPRFLLDFLASKTEVTFRFPSSEEKTLDKKVNVYLTVDDVPSAHTHLIVDALRDCDNGKALFFVIGERAKQYPDVLRTLVREGHEVGNHDAVDRLTAAPWRSEEEIKQGVLACEVVIKTILAERNGENDGERRQPKKIQWLRPGCGLVTPTLQRVAKKLNYQTLLGDVYGYDCHLAWWPWFLQKFYAWRTVPGSVIILHDGTKARATNAAAIIRHLYATKNISFSIIPRPK